MKTYPLLEKAPPHDSEKFIDYLRENNKVISEDKDWIVIQNCKYPWYTAFWKNNNHFVSLEYLISRYGEYEFKKKRTSKQTVKRFHLHLIK